MNKLFLLGLLVFLTSCATGPTCSELKVEKERKACYVNKARQQELMWMDRGYFNRR